jgi:hypothetical protein
MCGLLRLHNEKGKPNEKNSRVLAVLPATLLLAGCPQSQPDYTPFGDDMKAIGISLVVYGIVQSITSVS